MTQLRTAPLGGFAPPLISADERFVTHKKDLHQQLIASLNLSTIGTRNEEELRREIRWAAEKLCESRPNMLTMVERERLVNEVLDEIFGLGPLEALMRDPTVSDILINGHKAIYVERHGCLEAVTATFNDEKHLIQTVQRIVGRVGRRVDESSPMVDARLPDGSRINAVIPPLALDGSLVSIRRFGSKPLQMSDMVSKNSIAQEMVDFLSACIRARLNVLISGGTGSGKTTLLNALSASILAHERIVTIEDAAELRLQQPHIARMETRPPNIEGKGEINTRDLVRNALRMRPDRIIIGECRGGEALDMLQAMNTGHEGSMTTIHANDTRDAVSRLEMMSCLAGLDLPLWIIRRQIASALQIIVQVARLAGGVRKVMKISEITGVEGDIISMHDIFFFKQTGVSPNQVAQGQFASAGLRPRCLEKITTAGIHLPPSLFEPRTLTTG
jgi:pilus assembly protein CpaF